MKRATKGVESSLFEKSKEHIVESKCKLHLILCSISLHMLNSNHLLFEYWIMDDTILLTRIASSLAFTKILLNHHIHWTTIFIESPRATYWKLKRVRTYWCIIVTTTKLDCYAPFAPHPLLWGCIRSFCTQISEYSIFIISKNYINTNGRKKNYFYEIFYPFTSQNDEKTNILDNNKMT